MLSRLEGFSVDGVDFFRDDDNGDMFHYIPTEIELDRGPNGDPMFQYVLYQAGLPIEGKEQGGGFLMFTSVLKEDPDIVRKAKVEAKKIMRRGLPAGTAVPEPQIRPVNFIGGSANLLIAEGGGQLVSEIKLGRPSFFGNNTISVVADMPFVGAQVFADVLRQGGAIATIEYNLEFEERLPAVTINAHISTSRVREVVSEFTTQVITQKDTWGNRKSTPVRKRTGYAETLRENNLVELEIKTGSSDVEVDDGVVEDMREFALDSMNKFIEDEWMGVGGVLTDEQKQSEWMEFINEDFQKDFNMSMTQSDVVKRQYNPSAQIDPNFIGVPVEDFLVVVDTLAHPFFHRLNVNVSTNFDFNEHDDFVHSIVVNISYNSRSADGRTVSKSESFIFTKDDHAPKEFITAKGKPDDNAYEVEAEVHYKNGPVLKQRLKSERSTAPAQVITVDNPGELSVEFSAPPSSFDERLTSVDIELKYADRRNGIDEFLEQRSISKDKPVVNIRRPVFTTEVQPFHYRYIHNFDGKRIETPWFRTGAETKHLRVPTSFEDQLTVDMIPSVDWNELQSVHVGLEYVDAANDMRASTSRLLTEADLGKQVSWSTPLQDPDHREVSVSETHVLKTGAARVFDQREFEPAGGVPLIVGNAPGGVMRMEVTPELIDDLGGNVRRVLVALEYVDPENDLVDRHRALFRANSEISIWTVALMDTAKRDFTYTVEYMMADGSRIKTDPISDVLDENGFLLIDAPILADA